ncbi:Signal transduction histidine-protein kinase/phosphatase DegS [Pseudomonas oleovorans subsp. oleovorans]|uniref:Histidine kinase family protein n=1 Tax=Ectopseudomonas oleovorans TaxID=301 RepID=A0A379K0M1_ECTOL|nr:ATP-binding protein [Pseudomonas oleovorans]OWK44664.1 Signal transduction histidine-protein kinase/phosphatase DegS [Pseudomonas oleovorans subsp. oleovorans]SEJ65974.1 Histidine kinase [Pseudomonas oleovorans]SUD53783.1 histidine kinase family protein [Pseudomonas oleovorans]
MTIDAKVESISTTLVENGDGTLVEPTSSGWRRLGSANRSVQFVLAAALILGVSMTFVGSLVSQQIRLAAAQSAGEGAAIYMEAYLDEYVQELASARNLKPESTQAIDALMQQTSLNSHIVSVKIWLPDGSNVYSSKRPVFYYHPAGPIAAAMQGEVVTRLSPLDHDEHAYERSFNQPLYETYVPLREFGSGRIIAIGEFYEMEHEIASIHLQVWAIIAAATLAMLLLLFLIVRRGDRIIDRQQAILRQQMCEREALHQQNTALQQRVNTASHEFATINELTHRRLGADLHDGPAQLLTLILLRLDELAALSTSTTREPLETIRNAAQESLREIRGISRGLALPEINELNLDELLKLVVQRHEQRSETKVQLDLGELPEALSLSYKICVYRLVQEALNNAFHHAGGQGQRVSAKCRQGVLEVQVADTGAGIDKGLQAATGSHRSRLGLVGMRYRVESLGGTFELESAPGQGTRVTARFDLHDDENCQ